MIDNNKLYGSKLIKIPTPQFVVFYNGIDKKTKDTEILRLSDAFEVKSEGGFEWTATMININKGRSNKYLDNCKVLSDYSEFVSRIRQKACVMTLESAIIKTIKECIEEGILEEFLRKYQEEVSMMVWPEFDEELYRKIQREEAREEAREEVREELREELTGEIREELSVEIREEVREEIREELTGEIREELLVEVREEFISEGRAEDVKNLMINGKMSFEESCKLLGIKEPEKYKKLVEA